METVKIDAQKLQLLNDRIAQTIDALNQVRLSTHGLQQSFAPQVTPQATPQVTPQLTPQLTSSQLTSQRAAQWLPQLAVSQLGVPQLGVSQLGYNGLFGAGVAAQGLPLQALPTSLEHSAPLSNPTLGSLGFSSALGHVPLTPHLGPQGYLPAVSLGPLSYGSPTLGLSHSAPAFDPFWQLRLQSSFPYAQRAAPSMIGY